MEQWLEYGPHESLSYYMYQRPTSAKNLHFDIIPKAIDEYIQFAEKLGEQSPEKKLENPTWYIHNGRLSCGISLRLNHPMPRQKTHHSSIASSAMPLPITVILSCPPKHTARQMNGKAPHCGVNDTAALIRDALDGKFMDDKAA